MLCVTAYRHICYQDTFAAIHGNTNPHETPAKMPVISMAAANMPAVWACCCDTVCGAYIMPKELQIHRRMSVIGCTFARSIESHAVRLKASLPEIAGRVRHQDADEPVRPIVVDVNG